MTRDQNNAEELKAAIEAIIKNKGFKYLAFHVMSIYNILV